MRRFVCSAALVAALTPAAAHAAPAPRLVNANATSTNWAGYVASANGQQFSDVKGTWTQPTVTCAARQTAYSSFWVGLGGSTGGTGLEQIGTSADCQNGTPVYSSWWEILPAASTPIPFTPAPGDVVAGEVSVSGTTVTMTLTDSTSGATFSKTATVATPDTSSADWIAEAPSMCTRTCNILPLASFGTASFSAASATLGAVNDVISDASFGSYALDLRGRSGASATTSALGADGASFTVTAAAAPTPVAIPTPQPVRRTVPTPRVPRVSWWHPRHWRR